ncbi:hypothetical protein HOB87_14105 [Candidatus Woesearchaeota archaeon]|jgi:hypothetical protein|nr:hypothetical protein [Candidatus Woesearchaeota archaeon]MBT7557371.1 hypothetical protein [Candidatus Woesearchaeota archaeon]
MKTIKLTLIACVSILLISCGSQTVKPDVTENNSDSPWTIINSQNTARFVSALADEMLIKNFVIYSKSDKTIIFRKSSINNSSGIFQSIFGDESISRAQIKYFISPRRGYIKINAELGMVEIFNSGKESFVKSENLTEINWVQERLNTLKKEIETR